MNIPLTFVIWFAFVNRGKIIKIIISLPVSKQFKNWKHRESPYEGSGFHQHINDKHPTEVGLRCRRLRNYGHLFSDGNSGS